MFDHTTIYQGPSVLQANVRVTEKRAPTDESVRMLREMEAKAQEQVIKAISVQDNGFNGIVHTMIDYLSNKYVFRMTYSINGKKLTTDYRIDMSDKTPDAGIPGFIDAVAQDVAREILRAPLTAAMLKAREQ